jgi:RNA polymerase sigma factor (TIGR02999 family)
MPAGEITALLAAWGRGDRAAFDQLFGLLYPELHRLARAQLALAGRHGTLSPTGLIHEAYLKLSGRAGLRLEDRHHFFSLAARVMRQVAVDLARQRAAAKRGGGASPVPLEEAGLAIGERAAEIVALDEALERLEALEPRLARIVELRFFAGLSVEEAAAALALSERTVKREWQKARAFLFHELHVRSTP